MKLVASYSELQTISLSSCMLSFFFALICSLFTCNKISFGEKDILRHQIENLFPFY